MDSTSHNIGYVNSLNETVVERARLARALEWCLARAQARAREEGVPTPLGGLPYNKYPSPPPPLAMSCGTGVV